MMYKNKVFQNTVTCTYTDTSEWISTLLLQFLDSMFSQLFELLKEVQECDTKVWFYSTG